MIPKFTTHGYKKMEIPKSLYSLIYNARNTSELQIEEPCQILSNCRTKIMNIQQKGNLRNEIYRQLSPIMALWSGQKISKNLFIVYGIRRYLEGAWLYLHVDKIPRILSIILQVKF